MSTEADAREFFSRPHFAVVGASANTDKYGYKVFAWYHRHSLPVTGINPSTPSITVGSNSHSTVSSLRQLTDPKNTSISIITPPKATFAVLKEARELGIPAVWMQPGAFNDEVLSFARNEGGFVAVIAGQGGGGHEGWCVLVDGERALGAARAEKL